MTIVASIAFGMVIGVFSMKEKLNEVEFEAKLLLIHAEEVMEMNHHLMDDVMRREQGDKLNGNKK